MSRLLQAVGTGLLAGIVYGLSYLPFAILYRLSDTLYFLAYYIFRYRRTVVEDNLANAFPDKSTEERQRISKAYYRHLADVIVENIKLLTITRQQLLQRYQFENLELLQQYAQQDQSLIGIVGHYGNWEMGGLALSLKAPLQVVSVYKPFSNSYFDKLMYRLRTRFGAHLVPMKRVSRALAKFREEPTITMLISDQTPGGPDQAYWTMFLNQPTPVFLGPAKMAQQSESPLLYCHIEKVGRGYYKTTFHVLEEMPSRSTPEALTELHLQALEQYIQQAPRFWLWSHRRWKHDPPPSVAKNLRRAK